MISKIIYEYLKLNNLSSYNKCEFNARKIIDSEILLDDVLCHFRFKAEWYKHLSKKVKYHHFKFNITSIYSVSNIYRIHVNNNRTFTFNVAPKKIHKSYNESFVFIISKESNKYKIIYLANKEENPALFNNLTNMTLEDINCSRNIYNLNWATRLKNIDNLQKNYILLNKSLNHYTPYEFRSNSKLISINKLIQYARKYALSYNIDYLNFNNSGGDCTNFVSQALYFSGLHQSKLWKPYTAAWIMVNPLRDYIIRNDFAIESNELYQDPLGTIIQFYSDRKGRFSHSGIITEVMANGELLYCCHDYDKLDFPLSETYPLFYNKIRNLQIK